MRPTRYSPARVQEPNFTALQLGVTVHNGYAPLAYQFWSSYVFLFSRYDTVSVSAVAGLVTALVCDTGLRTPSLALKLLRIIVRGVCNRSTNFGVSRTFRSRLIGQHLSAVRHITWPCDLDLWPWRSLRLSLMRVFVLRLCTKFEVRRPSRSEDIGHLLCEH